MERDLDFLNEEELITLISRTGVSVFTRILENFIDSEHLKVIITYIWKSFSELGNFECVDALFDKCNKLEPSDGVKMFELLLSSMAPSVAKYVIEMKDYI